LFLPAGEYIPVYMHQAGQLLHCEQSEGLDSVNIMYPELLLLQLAGVPGERNLCTGLLITISGMLVVISKKKTKFWLDTFPKIF